MDVLVEQILGKKLSFRPSQISTHDKAFIH